MNNPKIALVNIYFVEYKMPLFELLHKNYNITYLMTRKSEQHTKSIKGTENFKVKHFKPVYFGRIPVAFGILKELIFSNYDVYIVHDPHTFESLLTFITAKLKRKKFLFYSETWDWPRRKLSKFIDFFVRAMFHFSDAGIVSSKKSVDYCYKMGYRKNKKIFVSIPPSLDFFDKKIIKQDINLKILNLKNTTTLLYLNRIVPYKGLDILLRSLSPIKDVSLIVCGTDDPSKGTRNKNYQNEISKIIQELNLKNIHFVGYSEELKRFYLNTADIAVFPVTTRDGDGESWGYTPEEAMSAKKPIIATDAIGCSSEIIKDGENGFVVSHNNVAKLSEAIKKLSSNKKLIKEMGENSRKIWESITWEDNFLGYKKAIEYSFNKI